MAAKTDVIHEGDEALAAGGMKRHLPEYSDMCPVCAPRKERAVRITAFHRSFVEFGYTDLTRADTEVAYDVAILREPTGEDGIIAKLIRSQLIEAGIVTAWTDDSERIG